MLALRMCPDVLLQMNRFISAEDRAYMSPSSSPDASPTDPFTQHLDSSPMSSPSLEPIALDQPPSPLEPGLVHHPYAGSTHATRRPPLYYKKGSPLLDTPPDSPTSSTVRWNTYETPTRTTRHQHAIFDSPAVPGQREAEIWEEAITYTIDNADGNFDLSCVFNLRSSFLSLRISSTKRSMPLIYPI